MSKSRYFLAYVPITIRLDSKTSNPYVTLNGCLQFMEDQMGNISADTSEIKCVQVDRKRK